MAVVTVTTLQIKPDRMQDYIEQVARKAKPILEKYGVRNCRVLSAVVAGEATGTVVFTAETDDFAGVGAALDKLMADPEGAELMSTSSASPMASYQTSLWVDIPL